MRATIVDNAPKAGLREAFENARGFVQTGQRALAIEQLEAILQVAPEEVNALCLLGSLRSVEGNTDEALSLLRRATRLAPGFHDATLELARVQRVVGDTDAAIETLQRLTQISPDLSRAWQLLGDSFCEAGRVSEGRSAFRKAAETDKYRERIGDAITALAENRKPEGEQILRGVLTQEPNHVHALVGLATLALDAGETSDAEYLLEHARRLSPYSDVVWRNVARLHSERIDNDAAETAARRAVDLDQKSADAWSMLGNVQAWGLKPERARESFQTSLWLRAEQPRVWMSLGHVRKTLGERVESEAAYHKALELDPGLGEAWWSLADLKTYSFDSNELNRMQELVTRSDLNPVDRAGLNFAIGKAHEGNRDFEPAFKAYTAGNMIKAKLNPFDISGFEDQCRQISKTFTEEFMRPSGTETDIEQPIPVFIVGLPRSGSTLLEQILASHSEVQGTMELPHILSYVRAMKTDGGYPLAVTRMDSDALAAVGRRYLAETALYRGDCPVFIDKMPNNFIHVGLIAKILPQAIIVDARRDPRDCCFSAFKQNFARGQAFSYDLSVLGRYYRAYVGMMNHWDRVLPGRVLRVQYEDIVRDTEAQIRRLLDHCGLEFEQACLKFHETARPVRTASAEQVRQPIYKSGVDHWRNFEPWLEPLMGALGDAVPDLNARET